MKVCTNARTQILSDWARECGIPHTTIIDRLLRGWTEQDAVTRPPAPPARHYITANGRTLALKAWAKKLGVGASVIRGRLALGWTETDSVTLPVHQGHYCKRRTR